jgi:hypothetical protein
MNSFKGYVVGALVALGLGGALAYFGVDKSIKTITDTGVAVTDTVTKAVTGPEVGTPEWFTQELNKFKNHIEVIKNQRYVLANRPIDFAEATTIRGNLVTNVKVCEEMVGKYNEQAKLKSVKELDVEDCRR